MKSIKIKEIVLLFFDIIISYLITTHDQKFVDRKFSLNHFFENIHILDDSILQGNTEAK